MHARYYSSDFGRFLSVDPVGGEVGSSQSWNRYAYSLNSPVMRIDPDGRVDQSGFDAYNRVAIPKPAERTLAQRKRDARFGGIAVSAALAYYTGGTSLVRNVITSAISNIAGGALTRDMDGDASTHVGNVGEITIDGLAGAGGGATATWVGGLLAAGDEATVSALAGGASRVAAEGTSNAAALALGEAVTDVTASFSLEGPNPSAPDPSVNCHLTACLQPGIDGDRQPFPPVKSH
jgi:uncharacterized protein RhaS with RHS repeats